MPNIIPINYLIIGFTVLISILAFNNRYLFVKLKHWPYEESRNGEYYRWLTSGLIHADPMHLIFNMLTLYFFGEFVEQWFVVTFPGMGGFIYLLFYLTGIIAASSATFFRYRNTPGFASIGASGAVASVLFASILIFPTSTIYFLIIPMKGFIFGIVYMWYTAYAARRGGDNIDHTAHYYGAVFGFFFPILLSPSLLPDFIGQIQRYLQNFLG